MRIVLIADTHNHVPELPDGDILVHAGDATSKGTREEVEQFDAWLGTLSFKHILFTPGNHDFWFEKYGNIWRDPPTLKNATILINEEVVIDGISFWASPYTLTLGAWAFMKSDEKLAEIWCCIPDKVDVLITHGPPRSILDLSIIGEQGINKNAGSQSLLDRIRIVKPKVHVFGHIHEAYGSQYNRATHYINASVVNEYYQNVNKPVVVEV